MGNHEKANSGAPVTTRRVHHASLSPRTRAAAGMTPGSRSRERAAAISAVASILAGILGGWLAGHWLWGAACALLVLLAIVVGAECLKARREDREDGPGDRVASMVVGDQSAVSDSIVAAGNIDQSRTTNIRGGAAAALFALLAVLALGSATGGTLYYAHQPGGLLSGGLVGGQLEPAAILAAAGGHDSPAAAVSGFIGNMLLGDWRAACSYGVPSQQSGCAQAGRIFVAMEGQVGIGQVAVSGPRAVVVLVGRICASASNGQQISSPICVSNSDPNADLGPNTSFAEVWNKAAHSVYSLLVRCQEHGGSWYV